MLRPGEICHTGSWNSKDKLLCSVVSFGPKSATVRLWEGRNVNKVVTVPFTSGKYLQPVKGGAKSACAKRILKGRVYSQMNDSMLQAYLQERSQELLSKTTETTKTTLSTDARDDETNGTTDEAVMAEAEEAADEAFHVIPCWFTEKGIEGDFEYMINQKKFVEKGAFLFNDNVEDLKNFARHAGGGNAIIRPYQHADMGAHAIGLPTGPYFYSLDHVVQSFMDDGVGEPLLTIRETLELGFARILLYLHQNPNKKKLYYSAATGDSKIGLGIFAHCTGPDVIDYASAILMKLPEMVVEMRKAKLDLDASLMPQLAKIVRKKVREIFVGLGLQKAKLSDTVPPLVYKYLDPALLDLKPGEGLAVPAFTEALPPPTIETSHIYAAATKIYNKYLNDTKTLPPEWGPADPSVDTEGYVCLDDYKRCVIIFWKLQGTEYELELVNLIDMAYEEYKKPDPTPMILLVRNMMTNRGVDKFLQTYFDDKAFTESQIINLAEMVALRRITEETEWGILEAKWVTSEAEAEEAFRGGGR